MTVSDGFDLGPEDPTASFGTVGDAAPPPMVEFRGHDGRSLAVPYSRLLSIDYRPDVGLFLEFPDHQISVRGRNLRPLYDALLSHRVSFVQEGDLDVVSEAAPFIDRIVIGPVQLEVE